MALIQAFDPVGTCTKDYHESLLVQIANHPDAVAGAYEVVEHHLEALEREKYKEIARKLHIGVAEVERIKGIPARAGSHAGTQLLKRAAAVRGFPTSASRCQDGGAAHHSE